MKVSYASICFYFTDYKLLCQRLVTQGNVLGIDAESVASPFFNLANKYILLQ